MKKSLLFIFVMVCFIIETSAQILHIPSDLSTIQSGIDSAANGDTVLVTEGTYFENINFKGKAITVASQFILDGDTSHISKTIIDGSKSTNPDIASTVRMFSGEDTTSVLMGFTITGGIGTVKVALGGSTNLLRCGGGIFIDGCGGKITNNIIEKNLVNKEGSKITHIGGGICARVYNNHSAIIRKNIIRNNTVTSSEWAWGGGIAALCGRFICENNEITNNSILGTNGSCGGGIAGVFRDFADQVKVEGVIHEAVIRNNIISGNVSNSAIEEEGGGGYYQAYGYGEDSTLFYNNIISNNHTNTIGGGMILENVQGRFFNNTIVDNTAGLDMNCIVLWQTTRFALYNNIMWNKNPNSLNEIVLDLWFSDTARLLLFNNIMMRSMRVDNDEEHKKVTAFNNSYAEPIFQTGSYQLAENSPGIGWAVDTIQIDTTWYYTPASDIFGNKRPDPVDKYLDLGAIESVFSRPANANLSYIGLWDRKLGPEFHKDTLAYVLPVPDTTVVTPQLDVIPEDWQAEVDINNAVSIGSADPADRTTTITVTACDGITQKTYTVLFRYASANATLSKLSVSKGLLNPQFNSDTFIYKVCLPNEEIITPLAVYETTDPYTHIQVFPASNIKLQTPFPSYRPYRTTIIKTTAEDGINKAQYEIEFILDKTVPTLKLVDDSVKKNDYIEVISTENCYIYLVPENTNEVKDSIRAIKDDTFSLASENLSPGKYWLFAIDSCECISVVTEVTILPGTGINENMITAIRLYPNPVDQILYIESSEDISSVELFNVIGIKVIDQLGPESQIDMSQLEQGIYFIRIRTERGEVYTGKVMKK